MIPMVSYLDRLDPENGGDVVTTGRDRTASSNGYTRRDDGDRHTTKKFKRSAHGSVKELADDIKTWAAN
jgi:hypothetical protein